MDELVIEDKKYISSKRAADITGYAKDYVGQLCREGHVIARRVGRNWYVLESAIREHRFGAPEPAPQAIKPLETPEAAPTTWESPRYESVEGEPLPSVNLLREPQSLKNEPESLSTTIEDAWQAWFDSFGKAVAEAPEEAMAAEDTEAIQESPVEPEDLPQEQKEKVEEKESESVAIHIMQEARKMPAQAPRMQEQAPPTTHATTPHKKPTRSSRGMHLVVRTTALLLALGVCSAAVLGTGYFDTKVASLPRVALFAGVSYYSHN